MLHFVTVVNGWLMNLIKCQQIMGTILLRSFTELFHNDCSSVIRIYANVLQITRNSSLLSAHLLCHCAKYMKLVSNQILIFCHNVVFSVAESGVSLVGGASGQEDRTLLDVPAGQTYTLFALAADYVGHEQETDHANIIQVEFPHKQGTYLFESLIQFICILESQVVECSMGSFYTQRF